MRIIIKRLELTNFKCFKHRELCFDPVAQTIRGRNGVGKTTIADAILWCLFGKNSQGKTTFTIKTHDEYGKVYDNLEHSVIMDLELHTDTGIKDLSLKRTLKEVWVKKRGGTEMVFKNNSTDYVINGEVVTAKYYDSYIATLVVSEDVFRAITNPNYFPSLAWQDQRTFLVGLTGDVTPDEVIGTDESLRSLSADTLSDIASARKQLGTKIKLIKDKLEKIPIRLEEQNKALPEKLDWEHIESEKAQVNKQLAEIDAEILALSTGNADELRKSNIRKELSSVRAKIDETELSLRTEIHNIQADHDKRLSDSSSKFNSLLNTQRDINNKLNTLEVLKIRCQETLDMCAKDAEEVRTKWAANQLRKKEQLTFDTVCPVCGQLLPSDQIEEKRSEAIQRHNESVAEISRQLTEMANNVKKIKAGAEEQIADYTQQEREANTNLEDIRLQINQAFADKAKIEKEVLPTLAERCAADEALQSLLQQEEKLRESLHTDLPSDKNQEKQLNDLKVSRSKLAEVLASLNIQLASKQQYERVTALIEGIEKEKGELLDQLSKLEQQEDLVHKYQDQQNAILETRINKLFTLVQWKLFRTVNNNGDPFDEPCCECYVNGTAYHDGLNKAAVLNAGLDIINTLCKHYGVAAPIILDNAESALEILVTSGQQIRLVVADTDLQMV